MASVSSWTSDDLAHLAKALDALSEARVNHGPVVTSFQYGPDTFTLDWDEDMVQYAVAAVE